ANVRSPPIADLRRVRLPSAPVNRWGRRGHPQTQALARLARVRQGSRDHRAGRAHRHRRLRLATLGWSTVETWKGGAMAGLTFDRRNLIASLAAGGATAMTAAPNAAATWSASGLEAVRRYAADKQVRGLVVLSGGRSVISSGEPAAVDRIASCRKSFLSALYGIAVRDQKIDLDATLGEIGVDDYSKLTEVERRATVRQLMQAR